MIGSKQVCPKVAPPQEQLRQLLNLYQAGELIKAEELAISLTTRFPGHPFGWKVLGVLYKQTGRLTQSLIPLQRAVEISPKDAEAYSNLGNALRELGRLDEAEERCRYAITLRADFAEAHINLGVTLLALSRPQEAEEILEKAINLERASPEAHNSLGVARQQTGKLAEAERSFGQAIALNPNYAEAHLHLGALFLNLGKANEAEEAFRKTIRLRPEYAEAHNDLAILLKEQGRFEEAEAFFARAISLKPGYADALGNLGSLLQEVGRYDESVARRQEAFRLRTGIEANGEGRFGAAISSVFFELTNKCNFHCTFCPSDSQTRSTGFMDFEFVERLYKEAAAKKIAPAVNLHLMGEPTLHPKLIEILNVSARENVKTDLVTNGSTLVAKVIPKILDSLYGSIIASHMTPTEDTYHFRGEVNLSWDRYISNIRLLVREYMKRVSQGRSPKCDVSIRVMVTQNTASNVNIIGSSSEASSILKEWNEYIAEVEREFGMPPFPRKDHRDKGLVRENKHPSTSYLLQRGIKLTFWRAFTFANTRVSEDYDLERIVEDSYCYKPFTDVGVLWNGDVTVCGLDHDGELTVGNARDCSIESVIQGDAAQKIRASMLGEQPLPSVCQKCQERPVKR